jgi:ElaB/YqjD/DUF883 family membrane-anchored ribosome-binding protein
MPDNTSTGTTAGTGTGAGMASGPGNGGFGAGQSSSSNLAQTAQDYAGKVSEAASQAKDYVTDKVSVVGDKIKDLDFAQMTEDCKQYARQNPGQAMLISAGIGLLLGVLVRGRR